MKFWKCLVFILLLWEVNGEQRKSRKLQMKFDKFLDNCLKNNNYTIVIKNANYHFVGSLLHHSYDLHLLEPLSTYDMVHTVEVETCKAKDMPDTCTKRSKFRTDKPCGLIKFNPKWLPLSCINPPLKCPSMPKGIYLSRNCSFSLEDFNLFPIGGSYCKLKVTVTKGQEIIQCFVIEGNPYYVYV